MMFDENLSVSYSSLSIASRLYRIKFRRYVWSEIVGFHPFEAATRSSRRDWRNTYVHHYTNVTTFLLRRLLEDWLAAPVAHVRIESNLSLE